MDDDRRHIADVVVGNKETKEPFSLMKGLFILGVGMFLGFFLAYELINTTGDVLHFDDVINLGSFRKTPPGAERLKRREEEEEVVPTYNGGMTSGQKTLPSTMTAEEGITNAVSTPGSNISNWRNDVTSSVNISDIDDYLLEIVTQAANQSTSFIYNITTTTTLPIAPCFRKDYQICHACEITTSINNTYGGDVTLENLGHMLFKVEIIDRLQDKCQDGEWCLSDDWLLISDNNEYLDFCYTGLCLRDNMPDECLDEKRRLIVSTLMLLCSVVNGTANITDQCFLSLRKMSHVTMAKLYTEDDHWETCEARSNCSNTCHQVARGLYCMDEICEHKKEIYEQYSQWHWYFGTDGDICQVDNNTICNFLISPAESWYDSVWRNLKKIHVTDMTDARVLSVVIVSGMIMVVGVVASVLACARKGPLLKRYSRDRVDYTPVCDDEDDQVFDTA